MDEAFSALDPLIRAEMQDQLLELQKTLHKIKDGRLIQVGTPKEILYQPADEYVDRFVQRRVASL